MFSRRYGTSSQCVLLYPVGVCPANPYPSLPALAGFLRANGVQVGLRDLNVEAYEFWLGHRANGAVSSSSPDVARAIAFMRGRAGDFYDPVAYARHRSVLEAALARVSERYGDVELTWGGYHRECCCHAAELRQFLRRGLDPVVDFLESTVDFDDLGSCDWIGISITFDPQLVPALLTALWLRERGYRGRIIFGGACTQFIVDLFEANPEWFDIIDALIVMEGESTLLALARDPRCDPAKLPNAVARCADGIVRQTGPRYVEEFRALPTPDYAGLPLDLYFSPAPILVTSTSRGCYYNRCAFCAPSFGRDEGFRNRTVAQAADDLRQLHDATGSRYVFFGDDCISPRYLRSLWETYEGPTLSWQTEMRFEPSLTLEMLKSLKEHGCTQLILGFESACQRVLNRMAKGTSRAVVDQVLDDCARVGINVNLQTMIGFPTETIAEAVETLEYLRARAAQVASFSMSQFRLIGRSSIMEAPTQFSISGVTSEGYGSLHAYQVETGMTAAQAAILSGAFYDHLQEDYPVNTFFLDGPMGAHALAYAAHGNLRELLHADSTVPRGDMGEPKGLLCNT